MGENHKKEILIKILVFALCFSMPLSLEANSDYCKLQEDQGSTSSEAEGSNVSSRGREKPCEWHQKIGAHYPKFANSCRATLKTIAMTKKEICAHISKLQNFIKKPVLKGLNTKELLSAEYSKQFTALTEGKKSYDALVVTHDQLVDNLERNKDAIRFYDLKLRQIAGMYPDASEQKKIFLEKLTDRIIKLHPEQSEVMEKGLKPLVLVRESIKGWEDPLQQLKTNVAYLSKSIGALNELGQTAADDSGTSYKATHQAPGLKPKTKVGEALIAANVGYKPPGTKAIALESGTVSAIPDMKQGRPETIMTGLGLDQSEDEHYFKGDGLGSEKNGDTRTQGLIDYVLGTSERVSEKVARESLTETTKIAIAKGLAKHTSSNAVKLASLYKGTASQVVLSGAASLTASGATGDSSNEMEEQLNQAIATQAVKYGITDSLKAAGKTLLGNKKHAFNAAFYCAQGEVVDAAGGCMLNAGVATVADHYGGKIGQYVTQKTGSARLFQVAGSKIKNSAPSLFRTAGSAASSSATLFKTARNYSNPLTAAAAAMFGGLHSSDGRGQFADGNFGRDYPYLYDEAVKSGLLDTPRTPVSDTVKYKIGEQIFNSNPEDGRKRIFDKYK